MNDVQTVRKNSNLAILGGEPVRKTPMPPRMALGEPEIKAMQDVVAYYTKKQVDPGYQGPFEDRYTDAFVKFMGGGYADAVATGTISLYIAVAALDLPPGSEVIVSPITDPGSLAAITLNRLVPRIADSAPDSYNMGLQQFLDRVTPNVRALVLVHSAGYGVPDTARIVEEAHKRNIMVLEDCAQSHGATVDGRPVGVFGDIAAFSTMYRKAHMSGGCGGIVYTHDLDLFRRSLALADRGKPRWEKDFDDRNPNTFLFPALNLHTDEISCAIGIASLARVNDTIAARLAFVKEFSRLLEEQSRVCKPYGYSPNASPFYYPVIVDTKRISCTKREFAEAVMAEGIGLNPHYQYLVADWPYLKPYLADAFGTPNARSVRDRSFCVYLNENYTAVEARDAVNAILKVEQHFAV